MEVAEYRVDELARAAGTTVRNVRVYQDRGLLPPPRREGRVGIYSDAHLARLRLIGRLLERNYTFAHIRELIDAWEQGQDLAEVLGLESIIAEPWSDELPTYLTLDQIVERVAAAGASLTADVTLAALQMGVVEPEGDRFRVPSPRLLHAGAELVAAGASPEAIVAQLEQLRPLVDEIARQFVAFVMREVVLPNVSGDLPRADEVTRLAEIVRRIRPLGQMVVDAELARALQREATEQVGDRLQSVIDRVEANRTEEAS